MDSINYNMTGTVFDIQRFSLHDGPGIRTIVFLKGCPLHCKWCSNPESQDKNPVVMYRRDDCFKCGRCISVCKVNAISFDNETHIDREKCTGCGECSNVCPSGALVLKGKKMTIQQAVKELKKDSTIFRRSDGGITLSGGEPLTQYEFASQLLKACKSQGWNTAIETTGLGSIEAIEKVIPYVDTVLLDIKHIDPYVHKKYTGVTNDVILENAKLISKISKTIVRVPVIPGFNYSIKDIKDIAEFVETLKNVDTIHLLPYHTFGENKYDLLGMQYTLDKTKRLKEEDLQEHKKIVESYGIKCIIGG